MYWVHSIGSCQWEERLHNLGKKVTHIMLGRRLVQYTKMFVEKHIY